jgi:ATP-dependent RNA helicase SUPV3L1/SUV3
MHKFNGREEVPLSVSQVKQIAGRAGRYGLHDSSAGGIVTTLNAEDLPLLKTILPDDLPPVPRAVMDPTFDRISQLALLMNARTSYGSIMQLFADLARLPQYCVFSDITTRLNLSEQLVPFANELSLQELETFTYAPVNIRDNNVVSTFNAFIRDFVEQGQAKVEETLDETGLMDDLALVSKARDAMPDKPAHGLAMPSNMLKPISAPIVAALPRLESLHKALVLYIWLSFRLELGFPERAKASALKEQTEELLDFCLERLPGVKQSKKMLHRRAKGHLHHDLLQAVPTVKKEKSLNWMTREDMADLRTAMRYGNIEIMDRH